MLTTIVAIYTIYVLLSIYTSVMQIGYINIAKRKEPVLLSESKFLVAGNYAVAKEKLSILNSFVEYLLFILWIGFGIAWLENTVVIEDEAMRNIAIVMGFLIIGSIISLPFSYYEKFVLDAEFGFNNSTIGLWIKDTLISFAMTLIFGSLVVWGIYSIISNFELWWLWSFAFIFAVIVLINMLYPTFRAMFFDKLTPLENEELDDEIKTLMDKTGFVSSGVFVSDASKRDARLNAYFGGFGKAKRVVLFDTLIEKLTTKELLAVLGHELGHFAHGDIYKNIALVGAMLFAMFGIFGNLPESLYLELGISESPYLVMILLLLFMPVLGFIMMPIMGIVSRHNEYEADKMGSELGGAGGEIELANALVKLVQENKSFPLSHPLYIFFHYTHPPVIERLKALGMDIGNIDKTFRGNMSSRYIVKDLLKEITATLSPHIPRASREAQLLLMAHLNKDELWLITNQNYEVKDVEKLLEWVDRRAKNEPFEYIVNRVSFYSEEFYIAEGALIPRPETEILIDEVVKHVSDSSANITFAEVGIGSGIISIMLAKKFPNAKIIAVDISQKALEVANKNIEKFGLEDRIELREGSLLEPISEHIDYLVSNPPYIEDGVELESNLDYEPQNALFGGKIGDEIIKKLLDEVLSREISFFSCEMGYDQKDKITKYLNNKKYKTLKFYEDLSGFDRGFTIRL